MPEIIIENCGDCPFYHIGEAEIGYTPKGGCYYGTFREWKTISDEDTYYKVLDDCPMYKEPITLRI